MTTMHMLILGWVAGCGPSSSGTPLAKLKPGDCATPVDGDVAVREVQVGSCREPHQWEVAGRAAVAAEHASGDHPGSVVLQRAAYDACMPLFEAHVGLPFWDSELDIATITPSVLSWDQGDREVLCMVVHIDDALLTESVKGSRR